MIEPLVSKILRNFSSLRVSAFKYSLMLTRCRLSAPFTKCDPRIEAIIADHPEITRLLLRQSNWLANMEPKTIQMALMPACQRASQGRQIPPTGSSTSRNKKGAIEAPLIARIPELKINAVEKSNITGFQIRGKIGSQVAASRLSVRTNQMV